MQVVESKVVKNDEAGTGYRLLTLRCPSIASAALPGQFVNLRVPGAPELVLRRPFSIFKAGKSNFSILYKIIGRGTKAMTAIKPGDTVSVLGPLGNSFPKPARGTYPLLVAGGCGVAPLCMLAETIKQRGTVLVGGRTCGDVLCLREFRRLGWKVIVATEDGSFGTAGLVTAPLEQWLSKHTATLKPEIYTCGPDGMLRAVSTVAAKHGVKCWVSMERYMGCGVGACLACVVDARLPDGTTTRVRVCKEGPVFDSATVAWSSR